MEGASISNADGIHVGALGPANAVPAQYVGADSVHTSQPTHAFPCMATMPVRRNHRKHVSDHPKPFNVCVARPVKPAEANITHLAVAALRKEWNRLRDMTYLG